MATVRDVAKTAGVSVASVSRVFSGHPSVSAELREKVLAASRVHDFTPSALGRALRMTGTRTVGLVVSDLMNPFFAELARAVDDAARHAGYSVIIGNADENPRQQDQYVQHLLARQLDGLIVVPTIETSDLLHEAAQRGSSIVLVDRPAHDVLAPLVAADTEHALADLVDHLVTTGRTRVGVIAGPREAGTARQRLDTIRSALAGHGLELSPSLVFTGDFRRQSGFNGMNHFLSMAVRPDAVVVVNGQMAIGALEALATSPAPPTLPHDMAFAAVDDLEVFRLIPPTITAIAQPTYQLGRTSFHMLVERMAGRDVADQSLPSQLVLRGSTAPLR